jgi:hypothetical protein
MMGENILCGASDTTDSSAESDKPRSKDGRESLDGSGDEGGERHVKWKGVDA